MNPTVPSRLYSYVAKQNGEEIMTGTVTLSVEIELAWGMHDMGVFSHLSDNRSSEETALARLLDSCSNNDLKVSFNVVGHLFEKSCAGTHSGPYPPDWWESDPGSTYQKNPQFYAPELVRKVINNPVEHELCTHTYSHILAEEVSDDVLHNELTEVHELHDKWDLPSPESIVMPRHQEVDYSILSEHGIGTIRRPIRGYGRDANPVEKLWWLMTRDHPKCQLNNQEEILETTCTPHPSLASTILPSGQKNAHPAFRIVPRQIRERIHRQYLIDAIKSAAKNDNHIHLWTHLHNIANGSQWRAIEPALNKMGELQKQGSILVQPMRNLPKIAN